MIIPLFVRQHRSRGIADDRRQHGDRGGHCELAGRHHGCRIVTHGHGQGRPRHQDHHQDAEPERGRRYGAKYHGKN